MIVDFDLPLLKLNGVKYSDENFKYNEYRLETWNSPDLEKLVEHFSVAQEIFFQDEMSINKDILDDLGLDTENITYELANLLFENLETAANLQKHTGVRFDEIKPEFEGQNESNRYSIDGQDYDTFYENELIATARELEYESLSGSGSIGFVIGEIKFIDKFYDVIDADKLWDVLQDHATAIDLDLTDAPIDSKKAIQWFAKEIDDDDAIFDLIDNNDLFNYYAYVDNIITDVDYAIDVLSTYFGDLEYKGQIALSGWKPQTVYIFEID